MQVWIVEAGMNYEPTQFISVCSTAEKGEKLRDELEAKSCYDWVSNTGYVVDSHEPDYSSYT